MQRGELVTGAFGEGFVDRRHPHAYIHELLAGVEFPRDGTPQRPPFDASFYVGRGFAPFGSDDPMTRPFEKYPVNHHLGQILERVVAVAAVRYGPIIGEVGVFNGDEPTGPGAAPNWGRFGDSWSSRLTLLPAPHTELSGSVAHVTSPEIRAGHGLDQQKYSLVARYDFDHGNGSRQYALVEWAHTNDTDRGTTINALYSVLGEAAVCRADAILAARLERTDRPEEEPTSDPFRTPRPPSDLSNLGMSTWTTLTVAVASPAVKATIPSSAAVHRGRANRRRSGKSARPLRSQASLRHRSSLDVLSGSASHDRHDARADGALRRRIARRRYDSARAAEGGSDAGHAGYARHAKREVVDAVGHAHERALSPVMRARRFRRDDRRPGGCGLWRRRRVADGPSHAGVLSGDRRRRSAGGALVARRESGSDSGARRRRRLASLHGGSRRARHGRVHDDLEFPRGQPGQPDQRVGRDRQRPGAGRHDHRDQRDDARRRRGLGRRFASRCRDRAHRRVDRDLRPRRPEAPQAALALLECRHRSRRAHGGNRPRQRRAVRLSLDRSDQLDPGATRHRRPEQPERAAGDLHQGHGQSLRARHVRPRRAALRRPLGRRARGLGHRRVRNRGSVAESSGRPRRREDARRRGSQRVVVPRPQRRKALRVRRPGGARHDRVVARRETFTSST